MLFNAKYKDYSDNDLINKFLESDDNAFIGILYQRYGHLVLGLCIKYLKNKDDAQDAVIHIFSSLMNDLKKHKVEFFKSWLYTYSKNHCLMELRKRQSSLKKELELQDNAHLFVETGEDPHPNEKEAKLTILEAAMEELNSEQKTCIRLFYLENRSYQEITQLTGYSSNEVKSFIQNGKRNLKIKMESRLNGRAQQE